MRLDSSQTSHQAVMPAAEFTRAITGLQRDISLILKCLKFSQVDGGYHVAVASVAVLVFAHFSKNKISNSEHDNP